MVLSALLSVLGCSWGLLCSLAPSPGAAPPTPFPSSCCSECSAEPCPGQCGQGRPFPSGLFSIVDVKDRGGICLQTRLPLPSQFCPPAMLLRPLADLSKDHSGSFLGTQQGRGSLSFRGPSRHPARRLAGPALRRPSSRALPRPCWACRPQARVCVLSTAGSQIWGRFPHRLPKVTARGSFGRPLTVRGGSSAPASRLHPGSRAGRSPISDD